MHLEAVEHGADVLRRVRLGTVRGEAKVHRDRALVGDDVAGDSPGDRDRVEPLAVGQPVHVHAARFVGDQSGQHRCRRMDGVDSKPGPGRVRAHPGRADERPQRALTAALDDAVRGLEQDREVRPQRVRPGAGEPAEAVARRVDLLAVVAHPGQVDAGVQRPGPDQVGDAQQHCQARLHVCRAAPVQQVPLDPRREVVGDRHRVEVAGEHDPLGATERGVGDHDVAVPLDGQRWVAPQRRLDQVGQARLVPRDRLDVDQRRGERTSVRGEIQHAARLRDPPR